MKVTLDRDGIIAVLKSPGTRTALKSAAANVAAALPPIRTHTGSPRIVTETHDARLSAAASVSIIHPGAGALEAKHGYLRKAASAARA